MTGVNSIYPHLFPSGGHTPSSGQSVSLRPRGGVIVANLSSMRQLRARGMREVKRRGRRVKSPYCVRRAPAKAVTSQPANNKPPPRCTEPTLLSRSRKDAVSEAKVTHIHTHTHTHTVLTLYSTLNTHEHKDSSLDVTLVVCVCVCCLSSR